ncbi:MAG: hypothetical protein ABI461_20690 [Polyangiaceae bacterium]
METKPKSGAKVPNRDEEKAKGSFHSKTDLERRDSHSEPKDSKKAGGSQKGDKNGGA